MSADAIKLQDIRDAISEVEVPTTEYWRGVMHRARKEQGISQTRLGELVQASQPTISDIESGILLSSTRIPAICVALGIPQPHVLFKDDLDRRWIEAGRVLRHRRLRVFRRWLDLIEADIEEASEDEPDAGE